MDSTMRGQMDCVMKTGAWELGWAWGSSSKGCLCALPKLPPLLLYCVCVGGVIFHSFDLDSSVPLEALTYFSVKSQRRGRWWVSATPLTCTPGLLKSSDLSEIWESREAQGARYVTLRVAPRCRGVSHRPRHQHRGSQPPRSWHL